jgi:hypothetical protein
VVVHAATAPQQAASLPQTICAAVLGASLLLSGAPAVYGQESDAAQRAITECVWEALVGCVVAGHFGG